MVLGGGNLGLFVDDVMNNVSFSLLEIICVMFSSGDMLWIKFVWICVDGFCDGM